MEYIDITIHKPLYDTFCYIRETYIKEAKRKNIPLRIKIPQGTGIMTVDEWMDGAKRIEKEFKIPGRPMILYGNKVKI